MSQQEFPITVHLASLLQRLFPDAPSSLTVKAKTIAELIEALDGLHPGMGDRIRDSTPAIRRHINVFVDGRRRTIQDTLDPGAEVFILTAVSGG